MTTTAILQAEHRLIEQVLDCLEIMLRQAQARQQLDPTAIQAAVRFFRVFADQCHHGKEETHLFPALEARGFPQAGGPTAVMRQEHEIGRRCVRGLAAAAESNDVAAFLENGRAFLVLLRQHIQKEDHCLFSMADQALSATDQEQLVATFERVEQQELGPAMHQEMLELADNLARQFGVPARGAETLIT